jgi:hypothetical protein
VVPPWALEPSVLLEPSVPLAPSEAPELAEPLELPVAPAPVPPELDRVDPPGTVRDVVALARLLFDAPPGLPEPSPAPVDQSEIVDPPFVLDDEAQCDVAGEPSPVACWT